MSEEWREHAVCRGVDPELFFPARGADVTAPKAICETCPVTEECLAFAVDNREFFGIWGGTSERQRDRVRRKR